MRQAVLFVVPRGEPACVHLAGAGRRGEWGRSGHAAVLAALEILDLHALDGGGDLVIGGQCGLAALLVRDRRGHVRIGDAAGAGGGGALGFLGFQLLLLFQLQGGVGGGGRLIGQLLPLLLAQAALFFLADRRHRLQAVGGQLVVFLPLFGVELVGLEEFVQAFVDARELLYEFGEFVHRHASLFPRPMDCKRR